MQEKKGMKNVPLVQKGDLDIEEQFQLKSKTNLFISNCCFRFSSPSHSLARFFTQARQKKGINSKREKIIFCSAFFFFCLSLYDAII